MAVLTTQQRNTLEKAVKQARHIAEEGARRALEAMAVNRPEPFQHMSADQRSLRNQLRAKARLLGDVKRADGHTIDKLSYELAYETWHKMLFAQFLEANHLLMHPRGVAVSFSDVEELAREEGYEDKWDAAAAYASSMLPAIFRPDDPLMLVAFAPDDRIKLERLLDDLDHAIFVADDALGWVYQFWQSEQKNRINKSGDKIDGEKLPAVTQLFTEPYMVHFLIDNTLGAWWVTRNKGIPPPVRFEYLRMHKPDNEPVEEPAAGKFEGWPDTTAEVTILDPCMGSGHFLATLFPIVASLRMHEEGLSKEDASRKVITENLHGLELDARCTQIAAFNVALTAWKFCGGYLSLPSMNLACSGIAPKGRAEDWVKLAAGAPRDDKARMENGMRMLYNHFQLAPELGSLLDPTTIQADAFTASFHDLQPLLGKALASESDAEQVERGVMAAGIAKAGDLLSKKYVLQITNVPYLARGKQDEALAEYSLSHYPEAKADLATVFLDRLLKTSSAGGSVVTVIPQNWLFLTSYKKLREKLLKQESWNFISRLGSGAFSQISGEVVKAILISLTHARPRQDHTIAGLDVSEALNAAEKDAALRSAEVKVVGQKEQITNPDLRISLDNLSDIKLLIEYADGYKGLSTGDLGRFTKMFWEIKLITKEWELFQGAPEYSSFYTGRSQIIHWENGIGKMQEEPSCYIKGRRAWSRKGISVAQMGKLPITLYTGELFDENAAAIIPKSEKHLAAIFSYLSSDTFSNNVRKIDSALKVTNITLTKVPFELSYWLEVAKRTIGPEIPKPRCDDPTQWLFHGHPKNSDHTFLVALGRLAGYRWPAEQDPNMELAYEARALIEKIKAFDHLSDNDGILCIPSVNGEPGAADRLRTYIQAVWGEDWSANTLTELLHQEGATSTNLEDWLRNEFFAQHCKVFHNRPFIWQIWDGRKDGFSALVNYHKLDRDNLSKLIYTYLGDWIRTCEAKKRAGESGAEGLLTAALDLKRRLELILDGEAPYDIFVRWKPLAEQPVGWDPDLNDGVRLNIRPFVQAGVLRSKFNIKWGIDRGKNPPGSPWGEKRDNDMHISLAQKRASRELIKNKKS